MVKAGRNRRASRVVLLRTWSRGSGLLVNLDDGNVLSMNMKTLLFIFALTGVLSAADTNTPTVAWETASADSAKVAVPNGWRSMDGIKRTMPIYRQGDGIGVPAADETGAPLQIGLTVEKFPVAKESTETIARELVKSATKNPQLEMVGKESVEAIKLSDKTAATLVVTEFIKNGSRRSLQMKLIAKDSSGQIWIVTGFLVGDKDSKWPTPQSKLVTWLRAHVVSLTLTGMEIDRKSLEAAYRDRDK